MFKILFKSEWNWYFFAIQIGLIALGIFWTTQLPEVQYRVKSGIVDKKYTEEEHNKHGASTGVNYFFKMRWLEKPYNYDEVKVTRMTYNDHEKSEVIGFNREIDNPIRDKQKNWIEILFFITLIFMVVRLFCHID